MKTKNNIEKVIDQVIKEEKLDPDKELTDEEIARLTEKALYKLFGGNKKC